MSQTAGTAGESCRMLGPEASVEEGFLSPYRLSSYHQDPFPVHSMITLLPAQAKNLPQGHVCSTLIPLEL